MSTRRFPNRIRGDWPDPYQTHRGQVFPVGQLMELPNGMLFRFSRMGAAIGVANKLYQSEVPDANFDTLAVQTQAEVGDTTLLYTNGATSVTENEFAEGTIIVESAAALGHIYPVKANTAGGAATITATLMDGVTIQAQLTTARKVTTIKNPWMDVIIHPSPPTAMCVGVPQNIVGVGDHGWLQTAGVCSILADATGTAIVIGQGVRPSEDDNGAVATMTWAEALQADRGIVGVALHAAVDGDFGGFFLRID